jgi:two-component system LytT family sensor kinase
MNSPQSIIHLVGFLVGLLLFLILLTLVLRNYRKSSGWPAGGEQTPRPLIFLAALIGVVWNLGGLIIYGARDWGLGNGPFGPFGPFWTYLLEALIISSLGFLPSVVIHSALSSESGLSRDGRVMVGLAYGLSLLATVLHFRTVLIGQAPPSVKALETLTIGFGILTVALVIQARRSSVWKRMFWLVALSFYAVSALHLSRHIGGQDPWFVELIGHHSSLPLVWAMLYRDYRFALADIFLKRALAVLALLVVAGLSFMVVGPYLHLLEWHREEWHRTLPLPAALAIFGIWFLTTLAFPHLRRQIDWLVDVVILRRADYQQLKEELGQISLASDEVEEILDGQCRRLQQVFTASEVRWEVVDESGESFAESGLVLTAGRRTTIRLPTQERPHYRLLIGELSGGRRFLSDDLALLEAVALNLVRRIDAVRMVKERYAVSLREREMSRLAAEAELRALRAQLNPHFLFNALTTVGYLIQTEPERAVETLLKLTGVLRAVLRAPTSEMVTLGEELALLESYLAVERARFEERLRVVIDLPPELQGVRIPALLLQPLVENAIKHGITPSLRGGEIRIRAAVVSAGPGGAGGVEAGATRLRLEVADTGVGVRADLDAAGSGEPTGGVGLTNVRRRLQGIYGEAASWSFVSRPGEGTVVTMLLPVAGEGAR